MGALAQSIARSLRAWDWSDDPMTDAARTAAIARAIRDVAEATALLKERVRRLKQLLDSGPDGTLERTPPLATRAISTHPS